MTMVDNFLQYLAPHHCCGCGESGSSLCLNCKYNIISEPEGLCVSCIKQIALRTGICSSCSPPYSRAWIVGQHSGALSQLIEGYKFKMERASAYVIAELLAGSTPKLPDNCAVIPIPTIQKHVRERGFDHTLLIAKRFAKLKDVRLESSVLKRANNTIQVGKTSVERRAQAKSAFKVDSRVDGKKVYLLIDDVMTTGATLWYAAKCLKEAGVNDIWIAVVARHIPENFNRGREI